VNQISFRIAGDPQGRVHVMAGRSAAGKTYARPSGSKSALELKAGWRAMVRQAAVRAMQEQGWEQVQRGALSLRVEFIRKRRSTDYWKGPHPEPRCWQGLDVKNLLTALEDALNGLVWRDDGQVSHYHEIERRYARAGEEPHATVTITSLGEWYQEGLQTAGERTKTT